MRTMRGFARLAGVAGTATLTVWMTVLAPSAAAAGTTRLVSTSGTDTGNCTTSACATLQYAVGQADPGDTVSVAAGSYPQSVVIDESLTLVGAGATGSGKTSISGDPQSGDDTILVTGLEVETAVSVTIKDLDLSGNGDSDGIHIVDADATVENCVASDNDANGIEVENDSTANITGVTADGNRDGILLDQLREDAPSDTPDQVAATPSATISKSDMSNDDVSGIDVETGEAQVDHSTINGNTDDGAYVFDASLDISTTTLDANFVAGLEVDRDGQGTLTKSTVSNTKTRQQEDSPDSIGAGVVVDNVGTADIDTSTIFGNVGQGILSRHGTVTVENSTVSGTLKPPGEDGESGGEDDLPYGGIAVLVEQTTVRSAAASGHRHGSTPAATVPDASPTTTVTGTIVADNTSLADCNGDVVDGGYNLDSDGSCAWSATGSISKGDPKLGPLQNNGGPTNTLKPAKGSDAVDVIPTGSAGCSAMVSDQRGVSRPQGPKCDVGAVEADQPPIVISPASLPHGLVGQAYSAKVTATGGLGAPYEMSLATGSGPLPPGLTMATSGKISGTPTQAGTFPITVSVDDPTTKDYTIVITAPAASSTAPVLSNTGANVSPLTAYGLLALVLGALLTLGGLARRAGGRHRAS